MRVGIPREYAPRERRIAAVPSSINAYAGWDWEVVVEHDAGVAAGFPDHALTDAGARIVPDTAAAHDADLVLRVGPPSKAEVKLMPKGSSLIAFLDPFIDTKLVAALAKRRINAVAVEAVPRTTLAQAMDALSSQANIAGYAAVLLAADTSPKLIPMLVTAAGTIPPSRALILGVGVAGLQAIATTRRLGAVVHAYDIRPETKEQVESLGAKFVKAPTQEMDEGGYAKEVDEETAQKQQEILASYVADTDLLITTAQIPGRPAPRLVTADMVSGMHPGAVVVDMAASSGGNVEGSRPDERVEIGGVAILGPTDLPSRVPTDASRMYARNLQELANRMRTEDDGAVVDLDDEVVGPATITHDGEVVNPRTRDVMGLTEEAP
jgi:NAD(P) transhydrogenase subunit alpha